MHNNANVIALGANDVDEKLAHDIVVAYDESVFETRHQRRIDKITAYESR